MVKNQDFQGSVERNIAFQTEKWGQQRGDSLNCMSLILQGVAFAWASLVENGFFPWRSSHSWRWNHRAATAAGAGWERGWYRATPNQSTYIPYTTSVTYCPCFHLLYFCGASSIPLHFLLQKSSGIYLYFNIFFLLLIKLCKCSRITAPASWVAWKLHVIGRIKLPVSKYSWVDCTSKGTRASSAQIPFPYKPDGNQRQPQPSFAKSWPKPRTHFRICAWFLFFVCFFFFLELPRELVRPWEFHRTVWTRGTPHEGHLV